MQARRVQSEGASLLQAARSERTSQGGGGSVHAPGHAHLGAQSSCPASLSASGHPKQAEPSGSEQPGPGTRGSLPGLTGGASAPGGQPGRRVAAAEGGWRSPRGITSGKEIRCSWREPQSLGAIQMWGPAAPRLRRIPRPIPPRGLSSEPALSCLPTWAQPASLSTPARCQLDQSARRCVPSLPFPPDHPPLRAARPAFARKLLHLDARIPPALGGTHKLQKNRATFTATSSFSEAGIARTAAARASAQSVEMAGAGEIRVRVADDRHFENTMRDYCGAAHDGDGAAQGLLLAPTEAEFLNAGLDLARRAIEGMEEDARGGGGPFLYTGLLGAALLCLRCHRASRLGAASGGGSFLERGARLVQACEKEASRHRTYFSFLCGQPGIHAIGAAIAAASGRMDAVARHMQQLRALAEDPRLAFSQQQFQSLVQSQWGAQGDSPVAEHCIAPGGVPHELLYGRAGLIWAVLFANEACKGAGMPEASIPASALDPIAATMIASGRSLAQDDIATRRPSASGAPAAAGHYPPLMYEWHSKRYWGAAHGLAGILHVLLLAHQAGVQLAPETQAGRGTSGVRGVHREDVHEDRALEDLKGTLRYLVGHRFPSGNYATSEERPEKDLRMHWCHGAPGVALTLASFAKAFPEDPKFMEAAEAAADVVWTRGLLTRQGLCHGASGNAYVFLALNSIPGAAPGHVHRARCFGAFLLQHRASLIRAGLMHAGDSPHSLMEGVGGPACLLLDLARPASARFPGYEL